ncbi:MAG: sterol desaturase family protein [Acidobacteriota bacterium]|nr:sterol desaturase family protein [Acidobacteriota bacterium]
MEKDYIALAIPVFFILIGVELVVARLQRKKLYRLNDSINDLSTGSIQQMFGVFFKAASLAGYIWIFQNYSLFKIGESSIWAWVTCFILVDFVYYWFHRLSHEINFLWAAHVVHHQSEEYNLTVALRQSAFQQVFSVPFYWPLALLGFPPVMFVTQKAFQTLYQFWIHTRAIGSMGPLEHILMTPSHHRVHHGRNPIYIDRNHGGTFIIWDKMFGTFQKEEEEVHFGITKPLASWNPIWANFHYWVELWQAASKTRSRRDKLLMFLKPPGWFPKDLGGFQAPPPTGDDPKKWDIPVPRGLNRYALIQYALVMLLSSAYLFSVKDFPMAHKILGFVMMTWSMVNIGALFEGRGWAFYLELARLIALPVCALFYVPLGAPSWLAPALAVNLVFALPLFNLRSFFLGATERSPQPV